MSYFRSFKDTSNGGVYRPRGQWESGRDRYQGPGGVRHWEGQLGKPAETENHAILSQERKADRITEENVSPLISLQLNLYYLVNEIKNFFFI